MTRLRPFPRFWLTVALLLIPMAAGATQITLTTDVDPGSLTPGQAFEVVVGLDDASELQAYSLGIEFDPDELRFLSARQLTSSGISSAPGAYAAQAFDLDPSAALAAVSSATASVLRTFALDPDGEQLESSILFADGRTTFPSPVATPGLFVLAFEATSGLLADGLPDLRVGRLDPALHAVTTSFRTGLVELDLVPAAATLQVAPVPEPGTSLLLTAGLVALALRAGRGRAS